MIWISFTSVETGSNFTGRNALKAQQKQHESRSKSSSRNFSLHHGPVKLYSIPRIPEISRSTPGSKDCRLRPLNQPLRVWRTRESLCFQALYVTAEELTREREIRREQKCSHSLWTKRAVICNCPFKSCDFFLFSGKLVAAVAARLQPLRLSPQRRTRQGRQATYGFHLRGIIYISSGGKRKPNRISAYSIYLE